MKRILSWLAGNCIVALFLVSGFSVFSTANVTAADSSTSTNSDAIDETKDSISELQKKLDREQNKKAQLEQNLNVVQSNLFSTKKVIQNTTSMIADAQQSISQKENELNALNKRLTLERLVLAGLIQRLYTQGDINLAELVIANQSFSQELSPIDHLVTIQDQLQEAMQNVRDTQVLIDGQKVEIAQTKEDHEKLLELKQNQQASLANNKSELVDAIEEKDATIGELQGKLAALKSNLSDMLGSSYDTDDIKEAANFAAKATGIRKDFLMGMLVVESDLGKYTGGCYAKDSRMSGTRLSLFKNICSELDYDWKKRKVSCPPKGYTGTGGAMGVAQFMSDTWMGYKKSIASTTGHNPPDPWNLTDGVTAMALKLSKVPGVKQKQRTGECNAAKLYLSGTTSSKYQWYCQKVLYWADNYQRLLD